MNQNTLGIIGIVCAISASGTSAVAGNLNPPVGPVASTLKTLDQVEPRTPINSLAGNVNALHLINVPGSYYLTDDIIGEVGKHGIQIIAQQNVTIDLNGFRIEGVVGSLDGIKVSFGSFQNLVVRNGLISRWDNAIDVGPNSFVGRIEDVVISVCRQEGVIAGGEYSVVRCIVRDNDLGGLALSNRCSIRDSSFFANTGLGLSAAAGVLVEGCIFDFNSGGGMLITDDGVVIGCTGRNNSGDGIQTGNTCIVRDCATQNNTGVGIRVMDSSTVDRCVARINGSHGIELRNACVANGCSSLGNVGDGINGPDRVTIQSSVSDGNVGSGINVGANSTVLGCGANVNDVSGIAAGAGSRVSESAMSNNGGSGASIAEGSAIESCTINGGGTGIDAALECTIRNCTVDLTASHAIDIASRCTVVGCSVTNAGDDGIFGISQNEVRGNRVIDSAGEGIDLANSNIVSGNTVRGSQGPSGNYDFTSNNQLELVLSEIPESIDWPASVTLSGTLALSIGDGITVNASDVTVDLGGHSLIGSGAAQNGIHVLGTSRRVAIRNGKISGWTNGLYAELALNLRIRELHVSECSDVGIHAGLDATVENCQLYSNNNNGITGSGRFANCHASANGSDGFRLFNGALTDCVSTLNGDDGFNISRAHISGCSAGGNDAAGIRASFGSLVVNNSCHSNRVSGVQLSEDCTARSNVCWNNGRGFIVTGDHNTIDGNSVTASSTGICIFGVNNVLINNTSGDNALNYGIDPGNQTAPIITDPATQAAPMVNVSH